MPTPQAAADLDFMGYIREIQKQIEAQNGIPNQSKLLDSDWSRKSSLTAHEVAQLKAEQELFDLNLRLQQEAEQRKTASERQQQEQQAELMRRYHEYLNANTGGLAASAGHANQHTQPWG